MPHAFFFGILGVRLTVAVRTVRAVRAVNGFSVFQPTAHRFLLSVYSIRATSFVFWNRRDCLLTAFRKCGETKRDLWMRLKKLLRTLGLYAFRSMTKCPLSD